MSHVTFYVQYSSRNLIEPTHEMLLATLATRSKGNGAICSMRRNAMSLRFSAARARKSS